MEDVAVDNNYEYLDHTADIQVHSWGNSLEEAFVSTAHAMVNYMYHRDRVHVVQSQEIIIEGNSLNRLLYNFLDEILYIFSCDPYMAVHSVSIEELTRTTTEEGNEVFRMRVRCHGEEYDRSKHGSKTEIKAVTFSNMRIISTSDRVDIYIIFDI